MSRTSSPAGAPDPVPVRTPTTPEAPVPSPPTKAGRTHGHRRTTRPPRRRTRHRTAAPARSLAAPADEAELSEPAAQRNTDISIKGNSGPIGRLEDDFLAFLDGGARFAVTFNSGTSALFAAYFALRVREGVDVVGPALTYHAALSPVFALRGDVVLADIDPHTRGLDPKALQAALTEHTKVVTVVHQWGHPCDMDAILRIAERHGLRVLEDCSHAHGSRYKGRPVGTFGDAAVFSSRPTRPSTRARAAFSSPATPWCTTAPRSSVTTGTAPVTPSSTRTCVRTG